MSLVIPGKRLGYQATSTKGLDIVAQEQSKWVTVRLGKKAKWAIGG